MRKTYVLTAAVAAAAFLAGCSGGSQSTPSMLPAGNGTQSHAQAMHSTQLNGAAPAGEAYRAPVSQLVSPDGINLGVKSLAVSDFGTGAVELLNKAGKETGTVTNGLDGPDGDAYDTKGNLYVANYAGINVQEYGKKPSAPTFTYSASMIDPVGVAVDNKGNVYVADYGDGSSGNVFEYAKNSNTVAETCLVSSSGGAEGVAIDNKGNVFVETNTSSSGNGEVVEYKGGLSGCTGTTLSFGHIDFAGGLIMDKHNNLVVCDQDVGAEIVKAPAYNAVSTTIAGDCFHAALNKANKLLFMAEINNAEVAVFKYPSGSAVTTLGSGNGLSDPAGVAAE